MSTVGIGVIEAVLFDFDGVIIDSEPVHFLAWQQVMQERGIDITKTKLADIVGLSDLMYARRLQAEHRINQSPESICARKLSIYLKIATDYLYDLSQEKAVIKDLAAEYTLAIVSSSHIHEIQLVVEREKIDRYFETIIGGNMVNHTKPHPEPYQKALDFLHLKPDQAVVIEDSLTGMSSALDAGIRVIWLNRYGGELPVEWKNKVYAIIASFKELPEIIHSIQ